MIDAEKAYIDEIVRNKKLLQPQQDLIIYLSKNNFETAKKKLGLLKQELVLNITLEHLQIGFSFIDMINEANIGLMIGIDNLIQKPDSINIDEFLTPFIQASIAEVINPKINKMQGPSNE